MIFLLLAIIVSTIIDTLICIIHKNTIHMIDEQRKLAKENYEALSKILNTKE